MVIKICLLLSKFFYSKLKTFYVSEINFFTIAHVTPKYTHTLLRSQIHNLPSKKSTFQPALLIFRSRPLARANILCF